MKYWIFIFIVTSAVLLWFKNDHFAEAALAADNAKTELTGSTKELCLVNLRTGSWCTDHTQSQQQLVLIRGQLLPVD